MKKSYQIISKTFIGALLLVFPLMMFGQNANRAEGAEKLTYQWYINLNGGISQSFCDIQSGNFHLDQLQGDAIAPSFGARLGKHISPVFGVYGQFMTGKLQGFNEDKDLEFETDLSYDMMLGGTMSLSNLIFGYKPRLLNLYLTGGIGLVNFTPETRRRSTGERMWDIYNAQGGEDLANGKTEINQTTETSIPVGGGIDFRLNDRWDLNIETTLRLFDSDKLDGYIAGEKGDAYYYTSLGVGYSFGKKGDKAKMDIDTEPAMLALQGDSIPVEIKGSFPESYDKRSVVDFTPVLKYGDQSKQLETIYFQGEEVPEEYQKDGAIVIPSTGGSFTYKTKIKYEPGMDVCELYVQPMSSKKGKTPKSMGDRKIADGLIMTAKRVQNNEKMLLAEHNYKRNIVQTETGNIYFVVNRHDVNFGYKLNKSDAAKESVVGMKDFIANGWEIKDINVNAWASPEGEESFNEGLSQRRSESAQKYVQKEYDKYIKAKAKELGVSVDEIKQDLNFNLSANGEDWDGFMAALQASDIKDKNIIANVVNSQPDLAKREQEIRNMTVIYKEIEVDLLPPLRRAAVDVNCYEPSLTDAEIAQYATSQPDSLKLNELLYAATLTNDMNAKLSIYKTVNELHPNCWRGYNNAGYAAAELGDYDAAKTYFAKANSIAEDKGVLLNNNGAMASKEKDFARAKENYMAAQKQGVDENYNMGIVKMAEGNYNGAINSFSGNKCDYNLALAHTMSGNYNAATSTLNCAEKTAEVYYLQAVIGSRTQNDQMVYENLQKAIAEDGSYMKTAKEDKEFMKYWTNPEFMNIVK
jgi:tetratricopeptide (TPR) repeat protein